MCWKKSPKNLEMKETKRYCFLTVTVNLSYAISTWAEKDTYTIAAKAKDEYGLERDWATLEVEMPVNQQVDIHPLFQRILERFPNAFPILRHLLGL